MNSLRKHKKKHRKYKQNKKKIILMKNILKAKIVVLSVKETQYKKIKT